MRSSPSPGCWICCRSKGPSSPSTRWGCQRETARKIIDKKADYILALKGNQDSLREDAELFADEQIARGVADTTVTRTQTVDGDHGRIETRTVTVMHDLDWLRQRHDWPGLAALAMVESEREVTGNIERERRRLRIGHGPANLAAIRHMAHNRKAAARDDKHLIELLVA